MDEAWWYAGVLLKEWRVAVSSVLAWALLTVIARALRQRNNKSGERWAIRLEWTVLGIALLVAPFRVCREQRSALARSRDSLAVCQGAADSARVRYEAEMRGLKLGAQSAEAARSRRVLERLGQFVAEADSLARTRGPQMYLADGVYSAWAARAERYLRTCGLDQTYRVRFIGAPGPDELMSYGDYGSAPDGMKRQRDLLVKFIDELRKVE
jgi:hypothetical protein